MNHTQVQNNEQNRPNADFRPEPGMHLHLVGIGGSGISAIAWVLLDRGYKVSGSDLESNERTRALTAAGATIYRGHDSTHISGADALIISSAVGEDNPEVAAARASARPVLKRADFLGTLMTDAIGIAVAGTHGKTTTTSLIAHALLEAGRDPSVIVGGVLPELGRNGRAGHGDAFVVEADEYDYMFLGLRPRIAVITNIEHDHPDIFPTPDVYFQAFIRFVQRLPDDGHLVVCVDDEGVQALMPQLTQEAPSLITYGLTSNDPQPTYAATDLRSNQLGGTDFVALEERNTMGLARLRLPGDHNVRNALAAIAVSRQLGVPFSDLVQALASFGGVGRRFQVIGEVNDVVVVDDYAHHPTEIRATLSAARQRYPGRRLWAIWQPHTYSRTKLLLNDFVASFEDADRVIVLDIYKSRERNTLGIAAAGVVEQMAHAYVRHIAQREDAADFILDRVQPGDVILTLGAGDGNQVGQWVLEGLRKRVAGTQ